MEMYNVENVNMNRSNLSSGSANETTDEMERKEKRWWEKKLQTYHINLIEFRWLRACESEYHFKMARTKWFHGIWCSEFA